MRFLQTSLAALGLISIAAAADSSACMDTSKNLECYIAQDLWNKAFTTLKTENDSAIREYLCTTAGEYDSTWINALVGCAHCLEQSNGLAEDSLQGPVAQLTVGPGKGSGQDYYCASPGIGLDGLLEGGANLTEAFELPLLFFNITSV